MLSRVVAGCAHTPARRCIQDAHPGCSRTTDYAAGVHVAFFHLHACATAATVDICARIPWVVQNAANASQAQRCPDEFAFSCAAEHSSRKEQTLAAKVLDRCMSRTCS